jgi:hypothetical protein
MLGDLLLNHFCLRELRQSPDSLALDTAIPPGGISKGEEWNEKRKKMNRYQLDEEITFSSC